MLVFASAGTLAVSVESYPTSGNPLEAPSAVCNCILFFMLVSPRELTVKLPKPPAPGVL